MNHPDPVSREKIAIALLSVLDGQDVHDLIGWGQEEEEAEAIIEIRDKLRSEIPDWHERPY